MNLDRRRFCRGTGALAASVLPLPARAAAQTANGFTVIEAAPGTLGLAPAPAAPTVVWRFGGSVPGPLIRVRRGDEVRVRLVNKLSQPTTLCWHGVRIANAMDGVGGLTQAPVPPGASFDYRFTPPDAGLYWYHPHVAPWSAEQIGRGLYGVLIVDETSPPAVDQDLLVVLDDWSLNAGGQIEGSDPVQVAGAGRIGSLVTVNSKAPPLTLEARPSARLRVRVLNACSARIAFVGFTGAPATIIALDGQPSEIFRPARDTVPLGAGARVEAMLDVPSAEGKVAVVLRGDGAPDRPLVALTIKGKPVPAHAPVAKLPDNPLLPTRIPLERSLRRELVIGESRPGSPGPVWTLAGVASDGVSGKPLFVVERGRPVTLSFVNKTAVVQQMHVHGHVWRLLHDLDDGWDPYWRDSVLLPPGRTKHVAFIADNPGKWVIESPVLDRQVGGLAGWFEVV